MPYVAFNAAGTRFVCAVDASFYVYSISPMELIYYQKLESPLKRVELLDDTNILLIIYENKPNIVYMWDDKRKAVIAEIETKWPILSLKIRKENLVIATSTRVFIYKLLSFSDPVLIETAENPNGALQITTTGKFLIATVGVNAQDLIIRESEDGAGRIHTYITGAHKSPIRKIALSPDGSKVATASEKGTIFRVFDVITGTKLKELRRGIYQTPIFDMTMTNDLLMSIGQTKTVHWHDLRPTSQGYFSSTESSIEYYYAATDELASKNPAATYICSILNENECMLLGNYGEYFLFRGMKMREKGIYKEIASHP